MEPLKVEEIYRSNEAFDPQGLNLPQTKAKPCIYYPEKACSVPKLQFKICRTCPKAAQFINLNHYLTVLKPWPLC